MPKSIRPVQIVGNIAYIPLTKGYNAIVDLCQVERVGCYNWTAAVDGRTVYAYRMVRNGEKQKMLYLHRFILDATSGEIVDHKDGDGLNNRLDNLRFCSAAENGKNKRRAGTNTSGFKGVTYCKRMGMWKAKIVCDGRSFHLGYHVAPELAYEAYQRAAENLHAMFKNAP